MIKNFKIFESQKDLNKQLIDASETGDLNKVKELINSGADIETKDNYDYTPLNNASCKGHLDIVKYLISVGAYIETKGDDGYTPLNNASWYGHLDIVKYLISVGADIETKNNNGKTPLDYNKEKIWSTKEIQELLIKQTPFNINLLKKYDIPIHPDIKSNYFDLDIGSEFGTI